MFNSKMCVVVSRIRQAGEVLFGFDNRTCLYMPKGTSGTTYKACIEMGITMAIKRFKDVNVPEMEFRDRIQVIGKITHQNLVPLRAYCFMDHNKFLLYDYMPMGSLSALLHGHIGVENGKTPINWDTRIGIALGAARAIVHLHSLGHAMSHGNMKSSNILLTTTFVALVSEFGLAHAAGPAPVPHLSDGYRAPEVNDSSTVSQKADVYSFGVVLLELLTGKDPTESHFIDEGIDLSRWVLSVVEDEVTSEVFELDLLQHENVEDEMLQVLQLAFTCSAHDPENRPSMAEVCIQIEELCCSSSRVHETRTDVEGVNSIMPTPALRLLYW